MREKDFDPVVSGARLLLGLAATALLLLAAVVWAALGCPLPDWHLPQPDQEQTPTSE